MWHSNPTPVRKEGGRRREGEGGRVTGGHRGLHLVSYTGYTRLQVITRDYSRLQVVTEGYT